ncbi:MAG: hypothetical protein IT167_12170 [Bryobacterales bacterium]|nr:hypothetical protein [Bryobacterales bacterium]
MVGLPIIVNYLLQRPRGLVIYPDNNSKWREFVYYKNGSSVQAGYKKGSFGTFSGSHDNLRKYEIKLTDGTTTKVAAAKKLDKKASKNTAYDPSTFAEIGYLNWELRKDAGGAVMAKPDSSGEFRLIGKKFKSLYGLPDTLVRSFENVHDDLDPGGTESDTRENFFDELAGVSESGLDFFAYAGHGGQSSLPSAQVRKKDMQKLADEIRRIVKSDGTVLFYACSTGVPGGFASGISSLLPTMTVWGHSDAGQASRNADKIRFRNGVSQDIRDLLSAQAKAKWADYLKASPDFYARFPFMTVEAIESELTGS